MSWPFHRNLIFTPFFPLCLPYIIELMFYLSSLFYELGINTEIKQIILQYDSFDVVEDQLGNLVWTHT